MTFEEAMRAMREGKTVVREKFLKGPYKGERFKIGKVFEKKCVVNGRGEPAYIFPHEILLGDWVVVNEKEDANGN